MLKILKNSFCSYFLNKKMFFVPHNTVKDTFFSSEKEITKHRLSSLSTIYSPLSTFLPFPAKNYKSIFHKIYGRFPIINSLVFTSV